jgi:hypothetical protein
MTRRAMLVTGACLLMAAPAFAQGTGGGGAGTGGSTSGGAAVGTASGGSSDTGTAVGAGVDGRAYPNSLGRPQPTPTTTSTSSAAQPQPQLQRNTGVGRAPNGVPVGSPGSGIGSPEQPVVPRR